MLSVPRCRLIFVVLSALAAALLFWNSLSLPAPKFEPVGGARVPQAAAMLILLLSVIAFLRPTTAASAQDAAADKVDPRGFVITGIFVASVFVLSTGIAGFAIVASIFLVTTQYLYRGEDRRWIARAVALAIAAIALEYLFTQLLVIDLPRTF